MHRETHQDAVICPRYIVRKYECPSRARIHNYVTRGIGCGRRRRPDRQQKTADDKRFIIVVCCLSTRVRSCFRTGDVSRRRARWFADVFRTYDVFGVAHVPIAFANVAVDCSLAVNVELINYISVRVCVCVCVCVCARARARASLRCAFANYKRVSFTSLNEIIVAFERRRRGGAAGPRARVRGAVQSIRILWRRSFIRGVRANFSIVPHASDVAQSAVASPGGTQGDVKEHRTHTKELNLLSTRRLV
jgi:hypothetical protein